MAWNRYINTSYYPENTSADAPEKILYFFIRFLCEVPNKIQFEKDDKGQVENWNRLFKCIQNKTNDSALEGFKDYYLVKLQEGKKSFVPIPFHINIPCTYEVYTQNNIMNNKGFGKKFLMIFLTKKNGKVNYELIKKLWDVLSSTDELNYFEEFILNQIKSNFMGNIKEYKLKNEDTLNAYLSAENLNDFKCKYQPIQFQKDLEYILHLNLPRVEKITWINNMMYYHFSMYMARIYYIIYKEEESFLDDNKDYCECCSGLEKCPFKGEIIAKSSISGINKETNVIRQKYKEVTNNILIKGYYRMIAYNHLVELYKELTGKDTKNIKEISRYYKDNSNQFIDMFIKKYRGIIEIENNLDYEIDKELFNRENNPFKIIFNLIKDYYEKKGSGSADNATKQVYNKLAGNKMGCGYMKFTTSSKTENYYQLDTNFLTFITNIIIGKNRNKMLLDSYWEEFKIRGFIYASSREKENIEKQLAMLGHLNRKSDAGESQYVERTV